MNNIVYNSTRGKEINVSASHAIVKGLAKDGGLFVPSSIPALDISLETMKDWTYQEIACYVLGKFLVDFTEEEIRYCVEQAYDDKFDTPSIAPLVKKENRYYLELFHGATIAFKDMALSILPYLMTTAAKKQGIKNDIVILTATSGDTGKAALEGFSDVKGTKIIVFYPKHGVSKIQERQMLTSKGANTCVAGIEGNFDDAQSGVKAIFGDEDFNTSLNEKGYQLSSANSINIGRLIPQVVYYVHSYVELLRRDALQMGQSMNVVVPTGNFGNILAAYYAKQMGLPIGKLICASNQNKVLYDFFKTGTYDRRRDFVLTMSPSMDILISSNLERLIYTICDEKAEVVDGLMTSLKDEGVYTLQESVQSKLQDFVPKYTSEEKTLEAIKKEYERTGYIIDPHTAVASSAYDSYIEESKDTTPTVIVSTASPYKFTKSTLKAIDSNYGDVDDFALLKELNKLSKVDIPEAVKDIETRPILHDIVGKKDEMPQIVRSFLEE